MVKTQIFYFSESSSLTKHRPTRLRLLLEQEHLDLGPGVYIIAMIFCRSLPIATVSKNFLTSHVVWFVKIKKAKRNFALNIQNNFLIPLRKSQCSVLQNQAGRSLTQKPDKGISFLLNHEPHNNFFSIIAYILMQGVSSRYTTIK